MTIAQSKTRIIMCCSQNGFKTKTQYTTILDLKNFRTVNSIVSTKVITVGMIPIGIENFMCVAERSVFYAKNYSWSKRSTNVEAANKKGIS